MAERKTYTYTPYQQSSKVNKIEGKKTAAETAYDKHVNEGYKESQAVIDANEKKNNADTAYNNYYNEGFKYSQQDTLNNIMSQILNREKFSYNFNEDAFYQQYKDKYVQQGKMAMADTMGQAAAMTGGYGNSYAASVGNQAYQASLQQLNDVIPELYQMALDKYNTEGQNLYNQYGLLTDDRNTQYGMWADEGNRLTNDRSYYSTEADNAFNRDYGMWVDKGNMLNNNRNYWSSEYDSAYDRDYTEHTTKEGYKYQDIADANAYEQWLADYNLNNRQVKLQEESFELQKAQAGATKNSNGSYTVPAKTPTMSAKDYDDFLASAEGYAEMGEDALAGYINYMVNTNGLSPDVAAAIMEKYFPTKKSHTPPKINTQYQVGNQQHMIN